MAHALPNAIMAHLFTFLNHSHFCVVDGELIPPRLCITSLLPSAVSYPSATDTPADDAPASFTLLLFYNFTDSSVAISRPALKSHRTATIASAFLLG